MSASVRKRGIGDLCGCRFTKNVFASFSPAQLHRVPTENGDKRTI
jgi:hypothetical protein